VLRPICVNVNVIANDKLTKIIETKHPSKIVKLVLLMFAYTWYLNIVSNLINGTKCPSMALPTQIVVTTHVLGL